MPSALADLQNSDTLAPLTFGALGDAYGFCFEFASEEFVARHNDLRYHQHPEFDARPGAYSDDTQMQIALAELLAGGGRWTRETIAQSFVDAFQRDPRPGYARRFHALLQEVRDGRDLLRRLRPASERNGAAMRAPVIGLCPELGLVVHRALVQAEITHDTPGGVDSAIAAALMSHYFVHRLGPKSQLADFLERHLPGHAWTEPWTGPIPVHGISTVRAAVTAIRETSSLAELLQRCVAFTGDVDSVAAIACACASSGDEMRRDIPATLCDGLEQGDYGQAYLLELDRRVVDQTVNQRRTPHG